MWFTYMTSFLWNKKLTVWQPDWKLLADLCHSVCSYSLVEETDHEKLAVKMSFIVLILGVLITNIIMTEWWNFHWLFPYCLLCEIQVFLVLYIFLDCFLLAFYVEFPLVLIAFYVEFRKYSFLSYWQFQWYYFYFSFLLAVIFLLSPCDETIYERECGSMSGFAVYYGYPNSKL